MKDHVSDGEKIASAFDLIAKSMTATSRKRSDPVVLPKGVIPTIKDLRWEPHSAGMGGESCLLEFPNGFRASILRGGPFYTNGGTYEIAVLDKKGIRYDTPITDDVLGRLDDDEANEAIRQDCGASTRQEGMIYECQRHDPARTQRPQGSSEMA